MSPLRVLYLIDSLGPGGAQRQLVSLVQALDGRLVGPEVAAYHSLDRFRGELDERGVPVHMLRGSGGRDPRVLVDLVRLLSHQRYDIVHSYLRTPGALARLAAPFVEGTRVVVSERNVDVGRSRARLSLERALCRRADAMIVNAEATKREVERLIPAWMGRVHVVPNGIDWREPMEEERRAADAFRSKHLGGAEVLVGCVGRVSHQKAPDLLAAALKRMPTETLSRVRVIWVGPRHDEALEDSVESELRAAGLGNRLSFLGETWDTRSVYLGIDGLVLPSRWEGMPNAVLEALAHGTPVVATDAGDTALLLEGGRSGWLVPPENADALASALVELVETPRTELAAMGRCGSEFVLERFSAKQLAERTMAVYEEVMTRDTHRAKEVAE